MVLLSWMSRVVPIVVTAASPKVSQTSRVEAVSSKLEVSENFARCSFPIRGWSVRTTSLGRVGEGAWERTAVEGGQKRQHGEQTRQEQDAQESGFARALGSSRIERYSRDLPTRAGWTAVRA